MRKELLVFLAFVALLTLPGCVKKPLEGEIHGPQLNLIGAGFFPSYAEEGSAYGEVTVVSPRQSHGFKISGGYDFWVLAIENTLDTVPMQKANLTVVSPNGTAVHFTYSPGLNDVPQAWWKFGTVSGGNYTVVVELAKLGPDGVKFDYLLSWCTNGEDYPAVIGPYPPLACHHRE